MSTSLFSCPLNEMVLIPGSDGSFKWGAGRNDPKLGDSYNWMLEAEYRKVESFCMMVAPFPGRKGYPYFESDDQDNRHGYSYGDIESVQDSAILFNMGLRLAEFREMAWFHSLTDGEIDFDACNSKIRPDGMLVHEECRTSFGVEIGLYGVWTFYDDEARTAHEDSILALTGDSGQEPFVGLPHKALGLLITGWGGGAICGSQTPYCVHQHVVEYRALWDGPPNLGLKVDPDDPFRTWPGSYWRDDLVMLVTKPGSPDTERQARYDELVERYETSAFDKAVLWDSQVGLF